MWSSAARPPPSCQNQNQRTVSSQPLIALRFPGCFPNTIWSYTADCACNIFFFGYIFNIQPSSAEHACPFIAAFIHIYSPGSLPVRPVGCCRASEVRCSGADGNPLAKYWIRGSTYFPCGRGENPWGFHIIIPVTACDCELAFKTWMFFFYFYRHVSLAAAFQVKSLTSTAEHIKHVAGCCGEGLCPINLLESGFERG